MRIQFIEFKNLFGYGEKLQRIEYSEKGKMILLKGKSGSGKSSIMNLPSILLYGKAEKILKPSIPNRINKNGYIRGIVEKGGHVYDITRTFAPYSISIKKDSVDLENIGLKDGQAYIDNEIIDMPFSTFSNLISISMKRFKSFLNMNPFDRKNIIDRIFSLEFINEISENIKVDMKDLSSSMSIDNGSIYSLKNSLSMAQSELEKRTSSINSSISVKIGENLKVIEKLSSLYDGYQQAIAKLMEKQNEMDKEIREESLGLSKIEVYKRQIESKIDMFSQEKCPTCGTSFKSEEFLSLVKDLKVVYDNIITKIKEKNGNIQQRKDLHSQIVIELQNMQKKSSILSTKVNDIKIENSSIENQLRASKENESLINLINQTNYQLEKVSKDLEEKSSKYELLNSLLYIYSAEGIKQEIINSYLPLFNSEIRKNLIKLNFPYLLEFNGKFDPILTDLGEPISTETISDGEMTRVDMVVLCSLLRILKRKYTSFNIFSIDELISYLDTENAEILLKFLKNFAEEMNLNILIVSHVDVNTEFFDEILETRKENGFSNIYRN